MNTTEKIIDEIVQSGVIEDCIYGKHNTTTAYNILETAISKALSDEQPKIDLREVEKLVQWACQTDCEESSPNPTADFDASQLRKRIGYSTSDLPQPKTN